MPVAEWPLPALALVSLSLSFSLCGESFGDGFRFAGFYFTACGLNTKPPIVAFPIGNEV